MSVSTSTSVASPPPHSPGRSSSSGTPPTSTAGSRHRSRPSFAIAYSHPPPSRLPVSSTSNAGNSALRADPKSPIGASSLPNKRPHGSSNAMPNPASSTGAQHVQQQQQPPKRFIAPAHPQSHHLHSLPPREKTTRTLILDHTAWRQGRTRIAQGRCELGMKVRFKSEERPGDTSRRTSSTGKRDGFYIGTASGTGSSFRRAGDFGEPPEVELASSDEEGDESEAAESDGEAIRGMAYGKHYNEKGKVPKRGSRHGDAMDVDNEDEVTAEYNGDGEPFLRKWPGSRQDPSVAKLLASRANGIEKVLNAMLAQPPSSPPRSLSPPPYALHSSHSNSQHYQPPPNAQQASSQSNADTSRLLPNGLRLRLALLTLVNDLFEREPPQLQVESSLTTSDGSSNKSTNTNNPSNASSSSKPSIPSTVLPPPSLPLQNSLPPELTEFVQISSQPFHVPPTLPSFHTLTLPSSSGGMSTLSPMSASGGFSSASPSSAHPFGGSAARGGPAHVFSWSRPGGTPSPASPLPNSPRPATPSGPTTHEKDSDHPPATSPTLHTFPRISGAFSVPPRQLPSSWSSSTTRLLPQASKSSGSVVLTRRARGRSRDLFTVGCDASPSALQSLNATNTFRSNAPTYGYSISTPMPVPGYPLEKLKTLCPRHLREKCRICEPVAVARGGSSTRIGAGLLKKQGCFVVKDAPDGSRKHSGSVLADLTPRFLRLSALVAMELGREARGEEPEANEGQEDAKSEAPSVTSTSTAKASSHAQPTREWFALLCGLLTRAVLEGYVARSWKGAEYIEVLMGVGLGIKGIGTRKTAGGSNATPAQELPTVEEDTDEFEPDEMPGLVDACKTLFTGLVQDASLVADAKEKATRSTEEEYVIEMEERMSEFLTVPHTCPDLATHLTQLSEKYPAEPVERAALRFCEAVAKWRGKPELEMYKKLPVRSSTKSSTPTPLPIDALIASTPSVSHRPPIYKYFHIGPLVVPPKPFRTLKRQRSIDQDEREPKKEKVEDNMKRSEPVQEVVDVDWVGPYGV